MEQIFKLKRPKASKKCFDLCEDGPKPMCLNEKRNWYTGKGASIWLKDVSKCKKGGCLHFSGNYSKKNQFGELPDNFEYYDE